MSSILSNPLAIPVIILGILVIVLFVMVFMMQAKLRRFLVDVDSDSITDSLSFVGDGLKELQGFRSEIEAYLKSVEKRLRKSVQSVHTVRFNPFKGTGGGGNQSFATAFLNEEGDGVIVSSLYSRDHVSIFAKPVKENKSEHGLSEEENEALENAVVNLKVRSEE